MGAVSQSRGGGFGDPAFVPYVTTQTFTANGTVVIPAGKMIIGVSMQNTTANAVTGGIKVGTTNGGVDVVAAQAVGANAVLGLADATLLKNYFSATVDTTLYVQTVTLWNSANVVIRIICI